MIRRINAGYWNGLPLGEPQTFIPKQQPASEVCIVATHLSGTVVQLRKSILLVHSHLQRNEPDVKFQIHMYIKNHSNPFGTLDASSEALIPLFPVITQLHFEDHTTTAPEIFDKATAHCHGFKYVLFLEDRWETVYFHADSPNLKTFTYSTPVFRQAMNLMEKEEKILEVWIGDTPKHSHYTNRSSWLSLKGTKRNWANKYRFQYSNKHSSLGITRPGGSLKHLARLSTLPSWSWITAFTELPTNRIQALSISNQTQSLPLSNQNNSLSLSSQEKFADVAAKLKFCSAHFCMTNDGGPDCAVDLEHGIGSPTTGIMWRNRIVMDEEGHDIFTDRP